MRDVICGECGNRLRILSTISSEGMVVLAPHDCDTPRPDDLYPVVMDGEVVYVARKHLKDDPDALGSAALVCDRKNET